MQKKKYFWIIFAVTLFLSKAIFAVDDPSMKMAQERAYALAQHQWGSQVKVDYGESFYNQNNEITAYMFAVYKNSEEMPDGNFS